MMYTPEIIKVSTTRLAEDTGMRRADESWEVSRETPPDCTAIERQLVLALRNDAQLSVLYSGRARR